MALGRKTGGRKKGTPNKIAKPRKAYTYMIDKLALEGEMPLEYMLRVLRAPDTEPLQRAWAAEKAAPYCHARLAPIDKDTGQQPVQTLVVKWLGNRQPMKSLSHTSPETSSGATTTDESAGPASSPTDDAAKRWPA